MTYHEACHRAREESREYRCSQHVVAILSRPRCDDEPRIEGYRVSDWYGDATVRSFENGREI